MQSILSVLHVWCGRWRLAVNEAKTKIISFRTKSKSRSDFLLSCGNTNYLIF